MGFDELGAPPPLALTRVLRDPGHILYIYVYT